MTDWPSIDRSVLPEDPIDARFCHSSRAASASTSRSSSAAFGSVSAPPPEVGGIHAVHGLGQQPAARTQAVREKPGLAAQVGQPVCPLEQPGPRIAADDARRDAGDRGIVDGRQPGVGVERLLRASERREVPPKAQQRAGADGSVA